MVAENVRRLDGEVESVINGEKKLSLGSEVEWADHNQWRRILNN